MSVRACISWNHLHEAIDIAMRSPDDMPGFTGVRRNNRFRGIFGFACVLHWQGAPRLDQAKVRPFVWCRC